jgi:hypothetical protein
MPSLPESASVIVAFLATCVANWLRDDALPHWANILIAACAFVLLAALSIALATDFSSTVKLNASLIVGGFAAVASLREGWVLLLYVEDVPSPLVSKRAVEDTATLPMKAIEK